MKLRFRRGPGRPWVPATIYKIVKANALQLTAALE